MISDSKTTEESSIPRENLRVRDPFILPLKEEKRYYLYGTTETPGSVPSAGFNAYYSDNLDEWTGPFEILAPHEGFWADRDFWAPEVHRYNGKYYLFASFKSGERRRATQILVADNPLGPFVPNGDKAITPEEWGCLDGTLFVDDAGDPWMVFCHEWCQVGDGEMCAVRLSLELDRLVGEPILLFTASQAPWSVKLGNPAVLELPDKSTPCYVTDGPYFHRTQSGDLLMIWSSFSGSSQYSLGVARSKSGRIDGPWTQNAEPLFAKDGGHAMLFETFEGQLTISMHVPNRTPDERAAFFNVKEENGNLFLEK